MTCRSTCFIFQKEISFLCTFLITGTPNQRWIFYSSLTKMYIIMFLSNTSLKLYALRRKYSLLLCRNCFAFSEEQHQFNDDACRNHAPATIKMPSDDENSFLFINFKAQWFAPFTKYFDFESFPMPVSLCPAKADASLTEVIEQHIPSDFALTLIENGFSAPKEFVIDSSENCMTKFIKKLHEMA